MIQIDARWSDVEALVRTGLASLRGDELLFRIHANERSITHRLAVHLEAPFAGWNVDCEYSRIGDGPNEYKRLLLPSAENVTHFDMDGSRVFPDIVIHHAPSTSRDPRRRRQLGIRNTLWTLWLRRPVRSAARRTLDILGSAPKDAATFGAVLEALRGLPWVLSERRVVPAAVERGLRSLEESQRHSPARRYVS